MGRQDYESETLIAHALSAEGFDASEDGTGRGVPMIPIAICTAHTQSNGSGVSDSIAHTLERGTAQAVAFSEKDYRAGVSDFAPILRGKGHDASNANGRTSSYRIRAEPIRRCPERRGDAIAWDQCQCDRSECSQCRGSLDGRTQRIDRHRRDDATWWRRWPGRWRVDPSDGGEAADATRV